MSASQSYVLLQFGDDPFRHRYEDLEGRAAFTIGEANVSPNMVIRITREAAWSQQHPSIMGPDNAYLYFGPDNGQGTYAYGNNRQTIHMSWLRIQRRDNSTSRYFRGQNGRSDYKWRFPNAYRMELFDGRTQLATWEVSPPGAEHHARLVIKHAGLAIVTEILTSLTLNRMASALGW
ncbi:hypothetical protein BDQ12DRAFT_203849 [Crucibulum laeve]|uniref:Uncharacterized protein n=1 Tax=Crucibulum laeve TaxID=68775 RepID=A0A5C3MRQ0_9AGAR|nr:hypothetical protein BDQ12DRAFT_203849 [Crucibulum laeve]